MARYLTTCDHTCNLPTERQTFRVCVCKENVPLDALSGGGGGRERGRGTNRFNHWWSSLKPLESTNRWNVIPSRNKHHINSMSEVIVLPLPQQPGYSSAGVPGVQRSRLSQHQDGETSEL